VARAEHPFTDGQVARRMVAGAWISLRPGPAGKVVAGRQGMRVLSAQDSLQFGR
jgi:hypothetical protein